MRYIVTRTPRVRKQRKWIESKGDGEGNISDIKVTKGFFEEITFELRTE
jgi:hypothetical protein